MFNDTSAQKYNLLLDVKQMVFTLNKVKIKYVSIKNSQGYKHRLKSCAKIVYHLYIN